MTSEPTAGNQTIGTARIAASKLCAQQNLVFYCELCSRSFVLTFSPTPIRTFPLKLRRRCPRQAMGKKARPANASEVKKGPSKRPKRTSKSIHLAPTIEQVFDILDVHKNSRLGREDIRRAAVEYGVPLDDADIANMVVFWDGSGTHTVSKNDFDGLCRDIDFK